MVKQLEALRALERGDLEHLGQLLGADPALAGARDAAGTSLVLHALYRRLPEAVELLLAQGPELDLPSAAAAGLEQRVAELLAAGEPPEQGAADGFRPLHLASWFGHAGIARRLLDAGADPAAPAAHPSGAAPLASAVAGGHLELARVVLAAGAPASPRQAGGFTPLHAAARRGDRALCELLLAHGADPAERDDAGADAGEHAARGGHAELAGELAARIERRGGPAP